MRHAAPSTVISAETLTVFTNRPTGARPGDAATSPVTAGTWPGTADTGDATPDAGAAASDTGPAVPDTGAAVASWWPAPMASLITSTMPVAFVFRPKRCRPRRPDACSN